MAPKKKTAAAKKTATQKAANPTETKSENRQTTPAVSSVEKPADEVMDEFINVVMDEVVDENFPSPVSETSAEDANAEKDATDAEEVNGEKDATDSESTTSKNNEGDDAGTEITKPDGGTSPAAPTPTPAPSNSATGDVTMGGVELSEEKNIAPEPFVQSVKTALNKKKFLDFLLKTPDGKSVKVHKVIVVLQSSNLSNMLDKKPKKPDHIVPCEYPILKAIVKYFYTGSYAMDSTFVSTWDNSNSDSDSNDAKVEFHYKVLQAADYLGVPKLEELAGKKLKSQLKAGTVSDVVFNKLQEVPAKKDKKGKEVTKGEPPFAITEAIIEVQARKVKTLVDSGTDHDEAFHEAARPVAGKYLAEFIQSIGHLLNVQYRVYLRCPNCASIIREKADGHEDFACSREDCGENALGVLIRDDRHAGFTPINA